MQRYDIVVKQGHYGGVYASEIPSDNGKYVLYKDMAGVKAAYATLKGKLDAALATAERTQVFAGSAMHTICGLGADPAHTDTVETLIAYAAQWFKERDAARADYAEAAELVKYLTDRRHGAEPDAEMERKVSEFEENYKAKT